MKLIFRIDVDHLSDKRLAEYKKVLNELIGRDADWQIEIDPPVARDDVSAKIRRAAVGIVG